MVLDIAAIQYLYGGSEYNNSDTVYTFDPNTRLQKRYGILAV